MKKRYYYVLSFLIPLLTMLIAMVIFCVAPFGNESFIIIDGLHQYIPFFSILYDKLKGGESLFYTFRTGMGINFLSMFSYYLSSPLNLVILLFKREDLNAVVSMLLTFKIALSGLFAGVYFTHKSKKRDWHIVAVSVAYALNGYMVGYSWNVMWLDAIMVLPLILLGIEKLIEDRDGRLYCLALFYALYCNYYIGFMICLFCVIWYLFYSFQSVKQFFTRGFAFTGYSLLAGGMAAGILLPAYLGIKATASGNEMGLPEHSWITSFWNLLARQFDMAYPITHDNFDGNANLYFGIFVVVFAFLYIFHKKIRFFDKIKKILLVALLYLSCNEGILNFIWHGFHNQYGIPNRFTFLLGFVLLTMAFEVLEEVQSIRMLEPFLAMLLAGGLLAAVYFKAENPLPVEVTISAGLIIAVYGLVLCFYKLDSSKARHAIYPSLIASIMIVEMMASALVGFHSNGQISISKFFYASKDMEEALKDQQDGSFYRSELASALMVDENAYYPMNAIGLFGSTARDEMVEIMDSLGFNTGCNEYLYQGGTPLTNLMFNVRDLYYHKEDTLRTEFQHVGDYGSMSVWRNPIQGMSIGYGIDEPIDEWYFESDYPFRVLEDFCVQGYNIDNVFRNIEIKDPVTNGCTVKNTNDGEYYFEYETKQKNNLEFSLKADKKMDQFFLFYDGTQVDTVEIAIDGQINQTGDLDGRMIPVGHVDKGADITISMSLKGEDPSGYIRVSAADFSEKQFAKITKSMTSQAFEIYEMNDHKIEGGVDFDKEKYIFFSIPYDEGWRVYVDGVEEDTFPIGNAFLSVWVEEGKHTVTLEYIPPGFLPGILLSAICLVIFLLVCIFTHFAKKKRAAKQKLLEEMEEKVADDCIEEIEETPEGAEEER